MASTISHSRLIVVEPNYVSRRAEQRARRIARARDNLHSGRAEQNVALGRDRTSKSVSFFLMVAFGLHGAVAAGALYMQPSKPVDDAKIQVRVISAPAPVIEPEPLPVQAPPQVEAPAPPPPVARKKATPKPEPAPEPAPAPLPIVGLTLESTSRGGGGVAFAVGSTLAGATDRVARTAQPAPPIAPPAPPTPAPSRNRVAAPRPVAGVHVEAAKRLSRIEPTYPPLLQSQRIEGDVSVRVELDGEGRVKHVEIVRSAAEPAFNEAALAAARLERFSPETHDGRPVSTSLTYTYRFRISL
jgi:protein TonB